MRLSFAVVVMSQDSACMSVFEAVLSQAPVNCSTPGEGHGVVGGDDGTTTKSRKWVL